MPSCVCWIRRGGLCKCILGVLLCCWLTVARMVRVVLWCMAATFSDHLRIKKVLHLLYGVLRAVYPREVRGNTCRALRSISPRHMALLGVSHVRAV